MNKSCPQHTQDLACKLDEKTISGPLHVYVSPSHKEGVIIHVTLCPSTLQEAIIQWIAKETASHHSTLYTRKSEYNENDYMIDGWIDTKELSEYIAHKISEGNT